MKILFINPLTEKYSSIGQPNREYMFPYSLAYLMNYLKAHDYNCSLIDLYMQNEASLFDYLIKVKPELIGLTCYTENRFSVIRLIRRIKKLLPESKIVVGGKHFTFTAGAALKKIPEIDFVVIGEGEITLLDLVRALSKDPKPALKNIKGIAYRSEDGEVVITPHREEEGDIDKFALDYNLLPMEGYNMLLTMRNFEREKIKAIPVLLGRGCIGSCVFCIHGKVRHRSRSMESIFKEIECAMSKYKSSNFSFNDPSFCNNFNFVKEFCNEILKRKLNIKWYCEARADTPVELLGLMRRAGLISCDFALESGSDRVLKAIKKKIDINTVLNFAKNCHALGIRTLVFTMISLPGETESDAFKTLEICKELSRYCYRIVLAPTMVFPGTELESMAIERGIIPEDFDWYDENFSNNVSKQLGKESMLYWIEHLSLNFIKNYEVKFSSLYYSYYQSFADIFYPKKMLNFFKLSKKDKGLKLRALKSALLIKMTKSFS